MHLMYTNMYPYSNKGISLLSQHIQQYLLIIHLVLVLGLCIQVHAATSCQLGLVMQELSW